MIFLPIIGQFLSSETDLNQSLLTYDIVLRSNLLKQNFSRDSNRNISIFSINLDGKYLVLPSGELHIKDVGPEDGYKSYQCRTKHRLTGETRLSATKGRLVITGMLTEKEQGVLFQCF